LEQKKRLELQLLKDNKKQEMLNEIINVDSYDSKREQNRLKAGRVLHRYQLAMGRNV